MRSPIVMTEFDVTCKVKRFTVPLLPDSVNTYTRHSRGRHFKSAKAASFEAAFPLFCGTDPVVGDQFSVSIMVHPAAKGRRFDIDNFPKQVLDLIARCGLLVNRRGHVLTDYTVVKLWVSILPSDGEARLTVEIEAI